MTDAAAGAPVVALSRIGSPADALLLGQHDLADHGLDLLAGQGHLHRPEVDDEAESGHHDHVPPQRDPSLRAERAHVDDGAHADEVRRQPHRRAPVQHRRLVVEVEDAADGQDDVAEQDRDPSFQSVVQPDHRMIRFATMNANGDSTSPHGSR